MAEPHLNAPSAPLSKKLWELDWESILPWRFEEVTVESGTFEDALPFMAEHYAQIFGTEEGQARFLVEPMTSAKRRFGAEMDVFLFRADGRTIGIFMSHPTDWSSYYIRTTAILPEYRSRHLVSRLIDHLLGPLRDAGVFRVDADVSPANTPSMKVLGGLGFMATSTSSSDRWGLMLRFTKFLREEAEAVFLRQYCAVDVRSPTRTKPELG